MIRAILALAIMAIAVPVSASAAPRLTVRLAPRIVDPQAGVARIAVTEAVSELTLAADAPLFVHQNMAPRMTAPVRIEDLAVADASGPVPLVDDGKPGQRSWRAGRAVTGPLTARYVVVVENASGGGLSAIPHVDGPGVLGSGNMLLLMPQLPGDHEIEIEWDLSRMPPGASAVTTFGDGDQRLAPGPLARLNFAMFVAGDVKRFQRGPFGVYWTGAPGFDVAKASGWIADLYGWMSRYFGDPELPRYSVFLRENLMAPGNGVAAPMSFVLGFGPETSVEGMKTILGHEMTHTWTAADLGKWYSEGNAVYYQARLPWLAGMISTEDYLRDINLTAARYFANDVITAPDTTIVPNFWTDMRYNVLPYDRGAFYFATLDARIRKSSGGKRSVDDLVRAMVARDRTGQPVTLDVWLALLRADLGEAGPAFHEAMIRGVPIDPPSDAFGPCFRRVATTFRRYDLGFGGPEIARRTVVEGLRPGSEAARAGLRDGDRVDYQTSTEGAQRDPDKTLTMHVTRGYAKFDVTYLPRGSSVPGYRWERDPTAADATCHGSRTVFNR